MAKTFISILGTNDYLPCTYYLGEKEVNGVRFVQEALARILLKEWTSNDRILVLTTDEAFKKNWEDDGHPVRNGEDPKRTGLKRRLQHVELRACIERVLIPEGRTEDEIWEIFEILYNQLQFEDELFLDVTHSFRSIPILAFAAINYARSMKKVSLGGIYYGAFEAIGTLQAAKEMPEEDRRAPIFNLTSFDSLMRWALAVDRFLATGDGGFLGTVAEEAARVHLKATRGRHSGAAALKRIAKEVPEFTDAMYCCRGPSLPGILKNLKTAIDNYEDEDLIAPFKPVFGRLKEHLSPFGENDFKDGIECARWCLKHNLLQQGYTILQETMISWALSETGGTLMDTGSRQAVGSAFLACFDKIKGLGKPLDEPIASPEQEPLFRSAISLLEDKKDLVEAYNNIKSLRNDLNHAGYRKCPNPPRTFKNSLAGFIQKVDEALSNH